MITLFTTFKTATEPERNAVDSWLNLHPETEVIIFTESDAELWSFSSRVKVVRNTKRHASGPPLLNHIFDQASRQSKHDVLCYCNSDIILLPEFLKAVSVLRNFASGYLGVSQRTDADIAMRIDFNDSESALLLDKCVSDGLTHPATGSDVFVFPRNQYSVDAMPNLVVGRPGWDLWMIYDARRRFNKVVDLNSSKSVVHQNHPANYNPKNVEHQVNRIHLPPGSANTFTMEYCNFRVSAGRLVKNRLAKVELKRLGWELQFNRDFISHGYLLVRYWFQRFWRKIAMKSALF